ncbi:MAG TPA: M81 family metallopeptidase, partial [Thermomicrobiaceae bacterium]|nr:M81 family metallopeptidase [Thermomicrobiaceae bacterium]
MGDRAYPGAGFCYDPARRDATLDSTATGQKGTGEVRLAFGSIWHVTNTFSPVVTTRGDFVDVAVHTAFPPSLRDCAAVVRAVTAAARDHGADLVPIPLNAAPSSGPVPADVYRDLLEDLTARIRGVLPVDGVVLALSGALVTELEEDGDAGVVERIRDAVGPKIPIGVVVSPLANLSPRLVRAASMVVGVESEADAVRLSSLFDTLVAHHAFIPALVQMPLLVTTASAGPASTVRELTQVARHDTPQGVVDIVLATGFPFADTARTGASVLVYALDERLATRVARSLADDVWARRDGLVASPLNVEVAVH